MATGSPTWVLIERRTHRTLASAPFGRLRDLIDDAVETGRAFLNPETGAIRLHPAFYVTLRKPS